jgi:nucleotide-binding universal stress UspA family protein
MIEAKKILVPVNGSPTDTRAVSLACQTAKRGRGKVYAVCVIGVPRNLPLDADLTTERAEADTILDAAERVADGWDQAIQTEILQARDIGAALVEEAIESSSDLIIIGVPYRNVLGQFDLGKTVPHVMENAPCEVWVCRGPIVTD